MADIIKFPQTAYEKLRLRGRFLRTTAQDIQIYNGDCAATAWLHSQQATEIAHRIARWIGHHAVLGADDMHASFPPGWHFEMIHGRPPAGKEEANFWAEMKGESKEFKLGFTRGLLHIVTMVTGRVK